MGDRGAGSAGPGQSAIRVSRIAIEPSTIDHTWGFWCKAPRASRRSGHPREADLGPGPEEIVVALIGMAADLVGHLVEPALDVMRGLAVPEGVGRHAERGEELEDESALIVGPAEDGDHGRPGPGRQDDPGGR